MWCASQEASGRDTQRSLRHRFRLRVELAQSLPYYWSILPALNTSSVRMVCHSCRLFSRLRPGRGWFSPLMRYAACAPWASLAASSARAAMPTIPRHTLQRAIAGPQVGRLPRLARSFRPIWGFPVCMSRFSGPLLLSACSSSEAVIRAAMLRYRAVLTANTTVRLLPGHITLASVHLGGVL